MAAVHRPPSLDKLLDAPALRALIADPWPCAGAGGRARARWTPGAQAGAAAHSMPPRSKPTARRRCEQQAAPRLRPVFNLTGTVLHTNLGRALLPPEAIAGRGRRRCAGPTNLEYDLAERRSAATATTTSKACCASSPAPRPPPRSTTTPPPCCWCWQRWPTGKEVPVSRGELIEIGGAFRIPDIMRRAGAQLVEVGTTNRTHLRDFAEAMSARAPRW